MLKLANQRFNKIRKVLLRRLRLVEDELKRVEKEDPVLADGLAETTEPGTDSWIADVHNRAQAVRQNLQQMLLWLRRSVANLRSGKYGKCEMCRKDIELERLEAMPTATLCINCSKKDIKKRIMA